MLSRHARSLIFAMPLVLGLALIGLAVSGWTPSPVLAASHPDGRTRQTHPCITSTCVQNGNGTQAATPTPLPLGSPLPLPVTGGGSAVPDAGLPLVPVGLGLIVFGLVARRLRR